MAKRNFRITFGYFSHAGVRLSFGSISFPQADGDLAGCVIFPGFQSALYV